MSDTSSTSPRFLAKLAPHAWWLLLLAALGLLWLATQRRIDRIDAVSNTPTWSVDAPQRDASSPTGFENGQRRIIVPGHHGPSFSWIIEAQLSAEQGDLRLRHIDYDAPPDGREIRRTSPYRWWLISVGWLHGTFAGEELGYSIERGALFADPLLLALMLVAGALYTARYIGSFAAIGFTLGGISLFPLAANYQPGAPDPHSLSWALALGSILPLFASKGKGGSSGRMRFVIAGAFGGLGFWNDASSQAPVLLALSVGALSYELIRSRGIGEGPIAPSHWREWALAGSLATLAASLFEFAPDHFSWSLDSVNPIHAVIWLGFGEALQATALWSRSGNAGFGRGSLALLVGAALAILSWPVVGILSDSGALLASDFYARELANHPQGDLASSLGGWLGRSGGAGAKWATLLPCVLFFALTLRVCMANIDWEEHARLVFLLVAGLFVLVLAFQQLRWWNLFDTLLLVALTTLFAGARGARQRLGAAAASLLALPGLFVGFPPAVEGEQVDELTALEVQSLIERDFSYWLAKRAGEQPTVLFSTPIFSTAAAYYGGFEVTASSDDSNETGFLTAVRIASASSEQEVSILLNSRNVTHVALPMWDPMLDQLVRIGRNLPPSQPLPQGAFSVALREWDFPLWMRPMNYFIPNDDAFQGFELRSFALGPEQTPVLSLSRLADFFLERGLKLEARAVRETLKSFPRDVAAIGSMASVDYAIRDQAKLKESLETLIPYMSRRAARDLPVDRRISLAALFMQTKNAELAKEQVEAALEALDAATLRALSPSAVSGLVALSRGLKIPFPSQELEQTALELIPPAIRARLPKANLDRDRK